MKRDIFPTHKRIKEKAKQCNSKKGLGFKDEAHLAKIRLMSCLVCGISGSEAHHIKDASIVGRDDRYTVPLCKKHHTGLTIHDGKKPFNVHCTPKAFYSWKSKAELIEIAKALYEPK